MLSRGSDWVWLEFREQDGWRGKRECGGESSSIQIERESGKGNIRPTSSEDQGWLEIDGGERDESRGESSSIVWKRVKRQC